MTSRTVRERWSAWMAEIDAYYFGIRGWGLVSVLLGAVALGWSLDDEANIFQTSAGGSGFFGARRFRQLVIVRRTTGQLVMDGTLALPLACAALALVLLLLSRRPFGRLLASLCGVGALAAVSVVAGRSEEPLLSGFILFWIATGAIALGACLCNLTPRVLARRGRTDDSFPA